MNFPKRSQRPSARAAVERSKREWVEPVFAEKIVAHFGAEEALPILRAMARASREDAIRIYQDAIVAAYRRGGDR